MKLHSIAKWLVCTTLIIGGSAWGTSLQETSAQAKAATRVVKVQYRQVSKKAYTVKKGTLYTTSRLKKVAHHGKNYRHTTFYRYKQGKVTRANHRKAIYYYVKSSNGQVKGWIWRGYLTAKPTTKRVTQPATSTTATTTTTAPTTPAEPTTPATNQSTTTPGMTTSTPSNSSTEPAQPVKPSQDQADQQTDVQVTILGPLAEGNKTIASGSVAFKQGMNAYDVLKTICDQHNIAVVGTDYVSAIDGKRAGTGGVGGGWLYSVNGVFPDVGCTQYTLKAGDVVAWMWTQTTGDRGYSF